MPPYQRLSIFSNFEKSVLDRSAPKASESEEGVSQQFLTVSTHCLFQESVSRLEFSFELAHLPAEILLPAVCCNFIDLFQDLRIDQALASRRRLSIAYISAERTSINCQCFLNSAEGVPRNSSDTATGDHKRDRRKLAARHLQLRYPCKRP